jgi:hypothetical protein
MDVLWDARVLTGVAFGENIRRKKWTHSAQIQQKPTNPRGRWGAGITSSRLSLSASGNVVGGTVGGACMVLEKNMCSIVLVLYTKTECKRALQAKHCLKQSTKMLCVKQVC